MPSGRGASRSATVVPARSLRVNGRELTIVGVAPPDFTGTINGLAFDLWTPVTMQPAFSSSAPILPDRTVRWLGVFGRLESAGTLASARAEAQTIGSRLATNYLDERDRGLTARTLDVGPSDRLALLLVLMLGINALVLLIVCTNVANLLSAPRRRTSAGTRRPACARRASPTHRAAADD